jgi:hypothetical protein
VLRPPLSAQSEWQFAFQLLREGDAVSCLCVLYPLVEHALRRQYVTLNRVEARRAQAESDSLFTTMDILLAPQLSPLCGAVRSVHAPCNELLQRCGVTLCATLYHLFIWPRRISAATSSSATSPFLTSPSPTSSSPSTHRLRDAIGHALLLWPSARSSTRSFEEEVHLFLCTALCLTRRFAGAPLLGDSPILQYASAALTR